MAITGALTVQEVRAVLDSLRDEVRPLIRNKAEVWQGQVVEVTGTDVRVARGDEPTVSGSLLRAAYPVVGPIPPVGALVWVASWVGGGIVITGGGGGGFEYIDFENNALPVGWTVHRTPADATTALEVSATAALEGTYGLRVFDNYSAGDAAVFMDKEYSVAAYGNCVSLRFLVNLNSLPTVNSSSEQIGGITSLDVDQADPIGLYLFRTAAGVQQLWAYRWHMATWVDPPQGAIITPVSAGMELDVEMKVSGLKTTHGCVELWMGVNGAPRTLRWRTNEIDFTNAIFDSFVPWIGPQDGFDAANPNTTTTLYFDSIHITYGGFVDSTPRLKGAFTATQTTQQLNIPDSTFTKINFDTEELDTEGWFATGNSRFTPLQSGYYNFNASVHFNPGVATAGVRYRTALYKNGALYREMGSYHGTGTTGVRPAGSVFNVPANGTTDYFEVFFWHNQGIATSDVVADPAMTYFSGQLAGT